MGDPAAATRNVFVRSTLEKLVAERDVRKNKTLNNVCKLVLDNVKRSPAEQQQQPIMTKEYLEPLLLAVESKSVKAVMIALDGLEKLIGYGALNGADVYATREPGDKASQLISPTGSTLNLSLKSPEVAITPDPDDADDNKDKLTVLVIDKIIDVVCSAYHPPREDDKPNAVTSQLEQLIVKVLMTALSSSTAHLHGHHLLKAVRTVYNVYLLTKDKLNHNTLRVSLAQLITIVFQRMEGFAEGLAEIADALETHITVTGSAEQLQQSALAHRGSRVSIPSPQVKSPEPQLKPAEKIASVSEEDMFKPAEKVAGGSASAAPIDVDAELDEGSDDSDDDDSNALRQSASPPSSRSNGTPVLSSSSIAVAAAVEQAQQQPQQDQPEEPLHEEDVSDGEAEDNEEAVKASEVAEAEVVAKHPRLTIESPANLPEDYDGTPSKLELPTPMSAMPPMTPLRMTPTKNPHKLTAQSSKMFQVFKDIARGMTDLHQARALSTRLQKDACLVFRALCNLSMKPTTSTDIASLAVRSKILSLQLLLQILQSANYTFQTSEIFIAAMQKYLILTMVSNAFNAVAPVLVYTLKIFHVLLTEFPSKLKYEVDVVFKEIFFKILQSKNSSTEQKVLLLDALCKIVSVPHTVLEIYLNYDCDPDSLDSNLYERLVQELCKIAQTRIVVTDDKVSQEEYKVKLKAMECVSILLQSLVVWCKEHGLGAVQPESGKDHKEEDHLAKPVSLSSSFAEMMPTEDNPEQFEQIKNMKHLLIEGIEKFNFKPKNGIKFLLQNGILRSKAPIELALFFLNTQGLNKTAIGEYLGEGDEDIIQIMHAFVDQMDFTGLDFLGSLRKFLNHFRLPGEAQKIDRFMLKFAERFLNNNPGVFANADTAYVLAYSVIMLNVDQHNPQVKKRMNKAEFIKNNRGINNNADLPEEILSKIFDEIRDNELKMKDEEEKHEATTMAVELTKMKDKRAAFAMESKEILERTHALFKEGRRSTQKTVFYSASRVEHVKPMFELAWMGILATASAPLQDSEDGALIQLSLDAFLHAIHITSLFFMELPKNAFVSTLVKFTGLYLVDAKTAHQLKPKNVATIRILLDAAYGAANFLGSSWLDVIKVISQLERLQLLSEETAVHDITSSSSKSTPPADQLKRMTSSTELDKSTNRLQEVSANQNFLVQVDKIFSGSRVLNGEAIVEFVKHLCTVSWDEVNAVPDSPRLYSLQKLVEISYYNMNRIRIEWSAIWAILGEHFNKVGCHANANVAYFAVDSLRQLSMKFLEKGELAHFQFQKDFLAPFGYIFNHMQGHAIRDLVVRCAQQMVFARASSIKSGWRAIMSVFQQAAKEDNENIATMAFDSIQLVSDKHLPLVIAQGSFSTFISTLVAFTQNIRFPKLGLQSMDVLVNTIPIMATMSPQQKLLSIGGAGGSEAIAATDAVPTLDVALDKEQLVRMVAKSNDSDLQFWFPMFYGLYVVVMSGDLEIRTQACEALFAALKKYGASLSPAFWTTIVNGILLQIFDDIAGKTGKAEDARKITQVDHMEWQSTTLILALRSLVDLYTELFDQLAFLMDTVMKLLIILILNDDETLARIGLTCFVSLIKNNIQKLSDVTWERVMSTLLSLFVSTLPNKLLTFKLPSREKELPEVPSADKELPPHPAASATTEDDGEGDGDEDAESISSMTNYVDVSVAASDRHDMSSPFATSADSTSLTNSEEFKHMMQKCMLQLLLIQTLNELLNSPPHEAYKAMDPKFVMVAVECLERSYRFAHEFNCNIPLRKALHKAGFTTYVPNLLKQETYACSSYLVLLERIYKETDSKYDTIKVDVQEKLKSLFGELLAYFDEINNAKLSSETTAWTKIVTFAVTTMADFPEDKFAFHVSDIYMPLVALLAHPLSVDLRQAIVRVFERVGATFHIVKQILAPHQEGNAAAAAAAAAVDQAHEHQSQSLLAPESSSPFTNDHPTSGDVNTTSQNLLEFASANAIAPSSSISVHSDHTEGSEEGDHDHGLGVPDAIGNGDDKQEVAAAGSPQSSQSLVDLL